MSVFVAVLLLTYQAAFSENLIQAIEVPTPKPTASLKWMKFYSLQYWTLDVGGRPVVASGMAILPMNRAGQKMPVISYQHFTETKQDRAPSDWTQRETLTMGTLFATQGYVISMADYLGFGIQKTFHPYLHAVTEAQSSYDMYLATQALCQQLQIRTNGQLFLMGYSQGGHSTMALHKYLQEKGISVTASIPMSGPYDLSETSLISAFKNPSGSSVTYASYLILGMNSAYGFMTDPQKVFQTPYDRKVFQLFDGTKKITEISKQLPRLPQDILQPDFISDLLLNPESKFRDILRRNDVYQWVPKSPVHLLHAGGDADVVYQNATVALQYMKDRGGNVSLTNLGDLFDHETAIPLAFWGAFQFIESFKKNQIGFATTSSLQLPIPSRFSGF